MKNAPVTLGVNGQSYLIERDKEVEVAGSGGPRP